MKLSKSELKRLIAEEIKNVAEADKKDPDPTKLARTAASTAKYKADQTARRDLADDEFSGPEKGIVNQLEAYFSKLASLPGVDLVQHTAILQRVMKTLESAVGKKHRDQSQGEQA